MLSLNLFLFFLITVNSISCVNEVFFRHHFGQIFDDTENTYRLAPSFVRMVFHDAIDYQNLRSKDSSDATFSEGGVDFCYNNPLKVDGSVSGAHNRNLPVNTVNQVKAKVNKKIGVEDSLSEADISVIGAVVALEEIASGPQIPIKLGRTVGSCKQSVNCSIKPLECAEDKYLRTSPEATSFDSEHFRVVWGELGFSAQEQTALMGAHSFGKLQVCAGGFNGIEHGPFSGNHEIITPEIEMVDDNNSDFPVTWNCNDKSDSCSPRWLKDNGEYGNGFGDGGVFDETPEFFDNKYFTQLLEADEYYSSKDFGMSDICCGKIKRGGCQRSGTITNFKTAEYVDKNELMYCRSDRKGRSHLKSLTKWAMTNKNFVKKADGHGYVKRVILLGGDASLLDRDDTKNQVEMYAEDENLFFDDFSKAYEKVTNLTNDNLSTCSTADCSFNDETLSYECGPLRFPTDDFACKFDSFTGCQLIGGLGARGIIQCEGSENFKVCCVDKACNEILPTFTKIQLD